MNLHLQSSGDLGLLSRTVSLVTGSRSPSLLRARERLTQQQYKGVTLWVLSGNTRAIQFYLAAGFLLLLEPLPSKTSQIGGKDLLEVRYVDMSPHCQPGSVLCSTGNALLIISCSIFSSIRQSFPHRSVWCRNGRSSCRDIG